MQSEADTPISQRYLWLEGKASPSSIERLKRGLPSARPSDTEIFFVGAAYADLPFGTQFDVVFPKNRPQDGVYCDCKIIAATQQWAKPFSEVPRGWSTVCVIHFAKGIPQLIQQLPVVDGWYQNKNWVCICEEETWKHLKNAA